MIHFTANSPRWQQLIFLLVLAASSPVLEAVKFGDISREEWEMQLPPASGQAPAIVLFEGGSLRIGGGEAKTERHLRFKIFNRLAVDDLINVEIPVRRDEHFGDFRAHTILPGGKKYAIKIFDLKKKKIGDSYQVYSFAFPRVEDGSIIEYQYDISGSRDAWFFHWSFQNDYYTCVSEFSFATASYLIYNSVLVGVPDSLRKPAEEDVRIDRLGSKKFTWSLQNVSPRVEEPYAAAHLNFAPSIYLQLVGYKSFWIGTDYIKDWADMSEYLVDFFRTSLDSLDGVKPLVDSLLKDVGVNAGRQISTLHAWVRDNIATTAEATEMAIPSRTVADCLRERVGTAIDKNMLLIAMLRTAQFQADVYMCADRKHAYFNPRILNTAQFNHALCLCTIGATSYLLDTSTKDCPFPHLPPHLRAVGGLRIGTAGWDTLKVESSNWPSGLKCEAAIWVRPDGAATCTTHVNLTGYLQKRYRAAEEQDPTADDIAAMLPALRGKSIELTQVVRSIDSTGDSTSLDLVIEVADFGIVGDGHIVCTPSLIWTGESTFPSETRQFPVDFSFQTSVSETIDVRFAENTAVLDVPGDARASIPGLLYSRNSLSTPKAIRAMSSFFIKNLIYQPEEYPTVKKFFDDIARHSREPLTLKTE